MAAILWWGGGEVIRGTMTIGAVVTFLQYSKRFYRPLMDLSEKYNILQAAMASSERDLPAPRRGPEGRRARRPPCRSRGRSAARSTSTSFASRTSPDEEVLKGVSFRAAPGETIALVGATGSGKSTIVNLLLRFYDVTGGRRPRRRRRRARTSTPRASATASASSCRTPSSSPGRSPRTSPSSTRRCRGRRSSAPAATSASARSSRASPTGSTRGSTERGGGLSVGEKQLVSFARALARDPRILILDEATSSVDPETEAVIEKAVDRLLSGRTSVVVAHRLSTVVRADRILVLSHGEVRESGTHAELLAKGGLYARLYALQLKDREAAA